MKSIKVFILATIAVCVMFYAGITRSSTNHASGPFLIFVSVCTAIGLTIDIVNHVRARIRKNNIRKLGF